MVQTVHLAHTPSDVSIFVALYTDVENADHLKRQLLAGNSEFEYAFVDADMVVSTRHIRAAAFRAVNDWLNHRLKSRNVHSEMVFCLGANNNIGEAFRRFGVGESTRNLLVLKVATPETPDRTLESVSTHLSSNIQGKECAFEDPSFLTISDIPRIRKVYKLGAAPTTKPGQAVVNGPNPTTEDVDGLKTLEAQILGLMALRGAT
jgi:EKC/KEOPS complex subunit CGI121/TPRKB